MRIPFSQLPGRHERHYRRRLGNPLFPGGPQTRDDDALLEVQRLDHVELLAFLAELRRTMQRAVELQANEGSEVILEIKESLDRLYETSAGLAEDQRSNQAAIRQLLEVIMRNVERGAAGDPHAQQELAQERIARDAHFALLHSPLVADLLHPDTTIPADELVPSLLSAEREDLDAALQLFDRGQLVQLQDEVQQFLDRHALSPDAVGAGPARITARLAQLNREMGII